MTLPADHFTDASVNQAILLRKGAGGIKHLTAKDLWVQETVRNMGIRVHRVGREEMAAHILASLGRVHEIGHLLQELSATRSP